MQSISTIASLLTLVAAFALGGCFGDSAGSAGNALERVQEEGVLVVAYADEEPYGYLDTASGDVTGEAPEIARRVATELGIEEVEMVSVEWKSLVPGLKSGRFDLIAAGMYITPERAENVIFSDPTYRVGEGLLVEADNPKGLHSYEDIAAHPEAKLGVTRGTVEVRIAEASGIPDDRVVVFASNEDAVSGLRSGAVDAFGGTYLTVVVLAQKSDGLEVAEPFEQPATEGEVGYNYGAFAFRPTDEELRDAFNEVLADYIGSAEHRDLVSAFGFTEDELPQGMTAEQVLERKRLRSQGGAADDGSAADGEGDAGS